jgi:DNA-binding transcriptional LysR family regulator
MNSKQINYFLTVAEENNFTAASRKMFVTQPAISRTIASLEKELNTKLFKRLPSKKIELTSEGQRYYNFFIKCRSEYLSLKKEIDYASSPKTIINIGYISGWKLNKKLFHVINDIENTFNKTSINLYKYNFSNLFKKLASGELDVIITLDSELISEYNVEKKEIIEINAIILYHEHFIQTHGTVNSIIDFKNATFYIPQNNNLENSISIAKKYSSPYGFTPQYKITENLDTALALVESGKGVMFNDTWSELTTQEGFHYFKLKTRQKVTLAYNKGTNQDIIEKVYEAIKN